MENLEWEVFKMKNFLFYDIATVCERELKHYFKDQSSLFMGITQPVIWLILMGFGMSGLANSNPASKEMLMGAANYITYIIPGILAMTAMYGGLYGGVSLLQDIRFGYINKMLSAPISRMSIVLGKILSVTIQTLLQLILIVCFSFCFGVEFNINFFGVLLVIIWAAMFCIMMCSISSILSVKMKTHHAIYSLISFITVPLMFTSNAFFPNDSMPYAMKLISYLNPLSYVVNSIRNVVFPTYLMSFWNEILLIVETVVLLFLAVYTFNKEYEK